MSKKALDLAIEQILVEYICATEKNGKFNSAHEGYAVILEELDELKEEVWKKAQERSLGKLRREAKQVAAMALRFMVDLT